MTLGKFLPIWVSFSHLKIGIVKARQLLKTLQALPYSGFLNHPLAPVKGHSLSMMDNDVSELIVVHLQT